MSKALFFTPLLPLVLASCGTLHSLRETASSATRSAREKASNTTQNITDFALGRPKVAIVKARQEDMKSMPLGKERALAFEQERKRSLWSFALPHFVEPSLPAANENEADGSLLPPKS